MTRKNFRLELMVFAGFSLVTASLWGQAGGGFAYVANGGAHNVSAYTIDAATGALTQVAGPPGTPGANPLSVTTTAGPTRPGPAAARPRP